ncbi:MAG: NAD(P)H-dependent oxidoreductase [Pseudomonadota bacterium]
MTHILRIDASARQAGSVTRDLLDRIEARLGGQVTRRDVGAAPLPLLTADWVDANFTPKDQRNSDQRQALALSDALVAEVQAADTLLIALPIYNFSVPASLKAWIDLIARAGLTFKYSETGPKGLLTGKRAIVVVASGGVPMDSPVDFATPYIRQVLGFIGIKDVTIVNADAMATDADGALARAKSQIDAIAA